MIKSSVSCAAHGCREGQTSNFRARSDEQAYQNRLSASLCTPHWENDGWQGEEARHD